jgi:ribosome-associated protein
MTAALEPAGGESLDFDGGVLARRMARAVDEFKGDDVRVLDVRGLTDVMDFIVLATAGSQRQLRALREAAEEAADAVGRHTIGERDDAGTGWTVVDTGDVVCHLMTRSLRAYYDLDGLWADAPTVEVGGSRVDDGMHGRSEEAE